jgi:hypothetical protein
VKEVTIVRIDSGLYFQYNIQYIECFASAESNLLLLYLRYFQMEKGHAAMDKIIPLALDDRDLIELMRILLDEDAEGALAFLKTHFKG